MTSFVCATLSGKHTLFYFYYKYLHIPYKCTYVHTRSLRFIYFCCMHYNNLLANNNSSNGFMWRLIQLLLAVMWLPHWRRCDISSSLPLLLLLRSLLLLVVSAFLAAAAPLCVGTPLIRLRRPLFLFAPGFGKFSAARSCGKQRAATSVRSAFTTD